MCLKQKGSKNTKMAFKFLVLLVICVFVCSVKLKMKLHPQAHRCFYEVLESGQKYNVDITPISGKQFAVTIKAMDPNVDRWVTEEHRQIKDFQLVFIHKLAKISSDYEFCVENSDYEVDFIYEIEIKSGLELLDLHLLPDNTDAQNLVLELEWINKEKEVLKELVQRSRSLRMKKNSHSSQIDNKVSFMTILMTIIIFFVNAIFYIKVKSTMKKRKLI